MTANADLFDNKALDVISDVAAFDLEKARGQSTRGQLVYFVSLLAAEVEELRRVVEAIVPAGRADLVSRLEESKTMHEMLLIGMKDAISKPDDAK